MWAGTPQEAARSRAVRWVATAGFCGGDRDDDGGVGGLHGSILAGPATGFRCRGGLSGAASAGLRGFPFRAHQARAGP
ncbi:hypothetical protein GCM10020358_84600 [Amorphoplanes nipponensis]